MGFVAPRNDPVGGLDFVMIRLDPPLLVKRMVLSIELGPIAVPISTCRVQPSAGVAQSGIWSQPPSFVDASRSAIGAVFAAPVRIEYAEPPSEYAVRMVKWVPTTELKNFTLTVIEPPAGMVVLTNGKSWEVK